MVIDTAPRGVMSTPAHARDAPLDRATGRTTCGNARRAGNITAGYRRGHGSLVRNHCSAIRFTGLQLLDADVSGQLALILDKLDAMLTAVGSDRTRIVAMTMYSTVIDDVPGGFHRPAPTTIGVARLALRRALPEAHGCAVVAEQR